MAIAAGGAHTLPPVLCFGVRGLGFRVRGFRVQGFRVQGLGFRVQGFRGFISAAQGLLLRGLNACSFLFTRYTLYTYIYIMHFTLHTSYTTHYTILYPKALNESLIPPPS